MRFYTQLHKFYCGIDLHARTMYSEKIARMLRGGMFPIAYVYPRKNRDESRSLPLYAAGESIHRLS